jgi:hypothetical protein
MSMSRSLNPGWFLGVTLIASANVATPVQGDQLAWSRKIGTFTQDIGRAVGADSNGHIYLAGDSWGPLTPPFASGGFLAQYDEFGNQQWLKHIDSPNSSRVYDAAVIPTGAIYVAFESSLGKFDNQGNLLWSASLDRPNYEDISFSVGTDNAGNAYVAGASYFANTSGQSTLWKVDATGSIVWMRSTQFLASSQFTSVAVDGLGNAYSAGHARTGSPSSYVGIVRKFNSDGDVLWTRQFGAMLDLQSRAITTDLFGNVFITGVVSGDLDEKNSGNFDAFIRKYDSSGNLLWSKLLGSSAYEEGLDVTTDAFGAVYITGYTDGNLGGVSFAAHDIFVAKYDANGNRLWVYQTGASGEDLGNSITGPIGDSLYVAGFGSGTLGGPSLGTDDAILLKVRVPEPAAPSNLLFLAILYCTASRHRGAR